MGSLTIPSGQACTRCYDCRTRFAHAPSCSVISSATKSLKTRLAASYWKLPDRCAGSCLYVSLVFFADTLNGFEKDSLIGIYPDANKTKLAEDVDRWIDDAYNAARKAKDFRECLTLLVGCGIGRAVIDF